MSSKNTFRAFTRVQIRLIAACFVMGLLLANFAIAGDGAPRQGADLVVLNISWFPNPPAVDENVTINAQIKNQGTDPVTQDFYVDYQIDHFSIGEVQVTADLNAGQSIFVTHVWRSTGGDFTVTVVVDSQDDVPESNEANNDREEVIHVVVPFPDYTVTSLIASPERQIEGRSVTLRANIKNVGDGGTLRSSVVQWYVDGSTFGTTSLSGMDADENRVITKTYSPSAGTHTIKVVADSTSQLNESDETNNDLNYVFSIDHADLVATDIWWEPLSPQDGESMTFTAQVENLATGGSTRGYYVQYYIDHVSIGSVYVQDNVQLGLMADAFSNSGFELGTFANWTGYTYFDLIQTAGDDEYYAQSRSTATLESDPFTLSGNVMTFNMKSSSSGKVQLRRATDNAILFEEYGQSGSYWETHIWDITPYNGQDVYLAISSGSSSYPIAVDDFRTGDNPNAITVASLPSISWTATQGTHNIQIKVDSTNTIVEANENNQLYDENFTIGQPDYTVDSFFISPPKQLIGGTSKLIADVRNIGSIGTVRDSQIRFYKDGVSVYNDDIAGLDVDENISVSYSFTLNRGAQTAEAHSDYLNAIDESNEQNNDANIGFSSIDPDLTITDIWWTPTDPGEGEYMTFYAQVENIGLGGTTEPYSVRFYIDGVSIGDSTVNDWVGFGQMANTFTNAGFEVGDFTNWTNSGVFEVVQTDGVDHYYARASTSGTGTLKSMNFTANQDILTFYMHSSTTSNRVELRDAATDTRLEYFNDSSSHWRNFVFDLRPYRGMSLYINVYRYSSYSLSVDDFRMGSNPVAKLVVAQPSRGWSAEIGTHTIKAKVDIDLEIPETNELNQIHEEQFTVTKGDYIVEEVWVSPKEQIEGGSVSLWARIKNLGNDINSNSYTRFWVDGVSQGNTSTSGIDFNQTRTVTDSWSASFGRHLVRAYADFTNVLDELNETNNDLNFVFTINRPDLIVSDIWWSPTDPQDGQNVTIYAEIQNTKAGGTTDYYDVRLSVDGVTLEDEDVRDNIGLAEKALAFSNADFETSGWAPWTSSSFSSSTRSGGVNRYAYSSYSSTGYLTSPNFTLSGDIFTFMVKSDSSSYTKVEMHRASDDVVLFTESNSHSYWHCIVWDISEYEGESVYIKVSDSTRYGSIYIDDFRMTSSPATPLGVGYVSATWTATAGTHNIKVEADVFDVISEQSDQNNDRNETITVLAPDYIVTDVGISPVKQLAGRTSALTATLKNQGGDTSRTSYARWYIDGVSVGSTTVSGMDNGETVNISRSWAVQPGAHVLKVVADDTAVIEEMDETNNDRNIAFTIDECDLEPVDIWWEPSTPVDGETITFYARIDNNGPGGAITDYYVSFYVDGVSLGSTMVYDDVNLGQRDVCFVNSDFESGNLLTNWGTTPSFRVVSHPGNNGYYAESTSGTGTLESDDFAINGDMISFYLKGDSSCKVELRRSINDELLLEQSAESNSHWKAYIWDVSQYRGVAVSIWIRDTYSSYQIQVDDFRMTSNPNSTTIVSFPTDTWTAIPGMHNVRVDVDTSNHIDELVETNQVYDENFIVQYPDYTVTSIETSPKEQLEGRNVSLRTTVKNLGPGDTSRTSYVRWLDDGSEIDTASVSGLDANDTSIKTLNWTVDFGSSVITAQSDYQDAIDEGNENNNDRNIILNFDYPDMQITDIWWEPQTPPDGGTVTFYAKIINKGKGGTTDSYKVRYYIDGVSIGDTTVYDDTGLAQKPAVFSNADFETGALTTNWTATGDFTVEQRAAEYHGYCSGSGTGTLTSTPFTITADTFTFQMQAYSSCYVYLHRASDDSQLMYQSGQHSSRWYSYCWDVSDYMGESVYIKVVDSSSSYSMSVDDFRMGTAPGEYIIVSTPYRNWTAQQGTHIIKTTVDIDQVIPESNELNQNYEEQISVASSDYIVTGFDLSPRRQIQGRSMDIEAIVKNISNPTQISSRVRFWVDSVNLGTTSMRGLASDENLVVARGWTTQFGTHTGKAKADDANEILEDNENNNDGNFVFSVPRPDLAVNDIWWSPANPQDGGTVTFTAEVVNLAQGGTTSSQEVKFYLDNTLIGTTTVNDEVCLGLLDTAFTNSDFESADWTNWTRSGTFSLGSTNGVDGRYAYSSSSYTGYLTSADFTVTDDFLTFSAKGSGCYVELYLASDNTEIYSEYVSGSYWDCYTWDTSEYVGQSVYIKVNDTSSYSYISVDDFRMGDNPATVTVVSLPTDTWTATTGTHYIRVETDTLNDIMETDETNNDLQESFTILAPDYTITQLSYSPHKQLEGRSITFYGTVLNQGEQTSTSSRTGWLVDGSYIGYSTVSGLAANASSNISRSWTVQAGSHYFTADADYQDAIEEADETNNDMNMAFSIDQPDLTITDIWWTPDQPQDGQSVTFTAQVENLGLGGSDNTYNVSFYLDGVSLGTSSVTDDANFGQRAYAFINSGFEQGGFTNWSNSGAFTIETREGRNAHYAKSTTTGTLESEPFTLSGDLFTFSWRCNGYGSVKMMRASDSTELFSYSSSSSYWYAVIWDISSQAGTDVFLRIEDTYSSYSVEVDDFRMGSNAAAITVVGWPERSWTAQPGSHNIKAVVDSSNTVHESNEGNQDYNEVIVVPAADYTVTNFIMDPPEQLEGRVADFRANIKNIGTSDQHRTSDVRFYADSTVLDTDELIALAADQNVVMSEDWTVEYGQTVAKVTADIYDDIEETNENNNDRNLVVNIYYPDLKITDIWYTPTDPDDGQTMTFYAVVENQGKGGTIDDYEVRFYIDGTSIGERTTYDDIALGQKANIFANADFEQNNFTNWTNSGSFELYQVGDVSTYQGYSGSGTGSLQSTNFTVNAPVLTFRLRADSYGRVQLCRASDNAVLLTRSGQSSSYWYGYCWDVRPYMGQTVYLKVQDNRDSSYIYVDDFGLGTDSNKSIIVATPSRSWSAVVGTHTVKASVDVNYEIPESSETNQSYEEDFTVRKADYKVARMWLSPEEQIIGKGLYIMTDVTNIANGCNRTSQVRYWLDGSYLGYDSISGVTESGIQTAEQSWTAQVDRHNVNVTVDYQDQIDEANENNNDYNWSFVVKRPDLAISNIWWVPQNPQDGQNTTFYAEIVNKAQGGDIADFDVRFYVDGVVLGDATVEDDIPLGFKPPAFYNSDFEVGDWTNWTQRSYFSMSSSSQSNDRHYAYSSYSSSGYLRSADFNITDNVFCFNAKASGSCYVALHLAADGSQLKQVYPYSSAWTTEVWDVTEWRGQKVYLYIRDDTYYGSIYVDDFRMGYDNLAKTVVAIPTQQWVAEAGDHIISVQVDVTNNVPETREDNNGYSSDNRIVTENYESYTLSQSINGVSNGQISWTKTGTGDWSVENQASSGIDNTSNQFMYYSGTGSPAAIFHYQASDIISTLNLEFDYLVQNSANLTIHIGPNTTNWTDVTGSFNLNKGGSSITNHTSSNLDSYLIPAGINQDIYVKFTASSTIGTDKQVGIDNIVMIYTEGLRPTPTPSPTPVFTYTQTPTPEPTDTFTQSPTVTDTPTPAPTITPTPVSFSVSLDTGWNSFTFPGIPNQTYTAETFVSSIRAAGIDCTLVANWNGASWQIFQHGLLFNNFTMEVSKGYFVRCSSVGTWSFDGTAITDSISLNLSVGWNLVGVPYSTTSYTSATMADDINASGGQAEHVAGWFFGRWEIYQVGLPFNIFLIENDKAYFVRMSGPSTWKP